MCVLGPGNIFPGVSYFGLTWYTIVAEMQAHTNLQVLQRLRKQSMLHSYTYQLVCMHKLSDRFINGGVPLKRSPHCLKVQQSLLHLLQLWGQHPHQRTGSVPQEWLAAAAWPQL